MFLEGLNRFSEDLDFTAQRGIEHEEMMDTVLRDLKYLGVRATAKIVNETRAGLSFKISAEGPLFTREIERCHVRVEISIREKTILTPVNRFVDSPYPDVLPFSVLMMDPEELLAEKVRAVMTREKARDIYDLWFLMRKGWKTEPVFVEKKLSYYRKDFDMPEFKEAVERKRGLWKSELKPIIFGKLPDFEAVKNEVLESAIRWVQDL